MAKKQQTCEGSGWTGHVSDYDVLVGKARCPKCDERVRISVKKDSNVVKVLRHSKPEVAR